MKKIKYHIETKGGLRQKGLMHVSSFEDFWQFSYAQEWKVLKATPQADHLGDWSLFKRLRQFFAPKKGWGGNPEHQDWRQTFKLLSQLIRARLTEREVISLMVHWTSSPLKEIFQDILQQIQSGQRLSAAFAAHK